MRTRIIAAFIAIPIVIIPIYLGGIWGLAFGVIITIVGCLELFDMLRVGGYHPAIWLGVPWAVMLFLSGWNPQQVQKSSIPITGWFTTPTVRLIELVSFPTAAVLIAGFIVVLSYCLFVVDRPVDTWLATSMVAIYLGVTLGQVVSLRFLDNGFWYVMFGLLVTWANDSAALFAGVTLGKHKLWLRISPKKTWEGTIGGWVAATASGALLAVVLPVGIGAWFGAIVGFLAGVLALFGDLSISMIKRQVGVKDSGTFFLGHGGLLDRMDSLLFTLPFIYQALANFAKTL